MNTNTEFAVDVDLDELDQVLAEGEGAGKKPCPECGKMVNFTKDEKPYKHKCTPPVVDEKLTAESHTEHMIEIFIDEVPGMPNYEVVGVNGKIYQIKRGENVKVPASVVEVLRNAIATRTVQKRNPATGEAEEEFRNYSAIPWRRV